MNAIAKHFACSINRHAPPYDAFAIGTMLLATVGGRTLQNFSAAYFVIGA
jgi:hypothetical protein